MNQRIKKHLIMVGAVGLIVLACIDWLIVIGVLFIAFIVWIASFEINKEESRYASIYFTSKQEVKEAKTLIEYGSSSHQIQLKSYMQDCVRYIATGKRTKSRYNFTYNQMKELGLLTLVNQWYRFKNGLLIE